MGSQMLTHQEETQSETQADYPNKPSLFDFYLDVYKPHLGDVTLLFLSQSDYISLLCRLLQTPDLVFCVFCCFCHLLIFYFCL